MAIGLRLPFTIKPGKTAQEVTELKGKLAAMEQRMATGMNIPGELFEALFGENGTPKINNTNASTLSAVWHAITIHCNSLNIPLTVFKRQPDGDSYPVDDNDRYEFQVNYLLHTSPNLMMTPSMWIQLMETSRLIYGNGYSYINRNSFGEPTALIWIHPDRIEIINNGVELKYNIKDELSGGYLLKYVRSLDMIHVRNISFNGFTGAGTIDMARESMQFAKSTQVAGNKFFDSGMRQAVTLTHPGHIAAVGQAALGKNFDEQLKSNKTIVLEEGIKPTVLSFSPEQSQFLASREFSVTEIARWFNLPESMLENNARSTFSNIEAKFLYFMQMNLRPRARIYEQEYDWKLLGNHEDYYTSYNINAIMRADAAARASYYMTMVQNGIMTRNEIRQLENMNNIDGGDEALTPLNLTTDEEREKSMEAKQPEVKESVEQPGGNGKAKKEDIIATEN
jgi:HK97 family phage portal protein